MTDKGVKKSMHKNPNLRRGLNTYRGKVTHNGVAAAFGLALIPPGKAIKA
jgi:alanine dehydrogenase